MNEQNKSFGQLLKKIRRSKEISQRELAEKVGVDFSYISKVENDRIPPPAADTIVKISNVLNMPSELLLFSSGKVSTDITEAISSSEAALKFMNEVKMMDLSDEEWMQLTTKLKSLR